MMTNNLIKLRTSLGKAPAILVLIAALCPVAVAQRAAPSQSAVSDDSRRSDKKEPMIALEEEMKAKRAIRQAERDYQENLDRARDLSAMGSSICASFRQKGGLDQEDIKKLEKVEKLAKGIRRAAGGSEDDVEMEKPPKDLAAAMEMLSELSQSLRTQVEKTPKHVISATVIDEANVLLELIRLVRNL